MDLPNASFTDDFYVILDDIDTLYMNLNMITYYENNDISCSELVI